MTMDGRVAQLVNAARQAQQAGRLDEAAQLMEQALALAPDDPRILNALGTIRLGLGQPQAAHGLFTRAAAADPGEPILWLNVARACRDMGDHGGEQEALDRVLAIDARHFVALIRKGHLAERRGEDSRAAALYGRAAAVAPPETQLPAELAALLAHGRDFASARQSAFGAVIDTAMAEAMQDRPPAETRRVRAAIDRMLGRRQIYANDCAAMHVPFLPADEFFDRSHFPWLDELETAAPAVRAELQDLLAHGDTGFAPYVQFPSGYPESKWSELDHSKRWSAYFLWRHGKRVDEHCARCPQTAALLDRLPLADHAGRAPTVFFSLLHPRTRIPPHTGVTNARSIVHLALIVPEGCGFRVGGETRQWVEGEAFVFDDTIEHEAWNDSDQLRAVLILDTWNPHIRADERALINHFFAAADTSGMDPFPEEH